MELLWKLKDCGAYAAKNQVFTVAVVGLFSHSINERVV